MSNDSSKITSTEDISKHLQPPIPQNWWVNRNSLGKGWFVQTLETATKNFYTLYWNYQPVASYDVHIDIGPLSPPVEMPDNHMLDIPPSGDPFKDDRMKQGSTIEKH